MEAIILAGGRGTRLAAVVSDLPKPLAPVAGRPFLSYVLDELAAQGVGRVVLSVGYLADAVVAQFGDHYAGLEIVYCLEETPLGTGGAIRLALTQATESHVLVLNGDTFATIDYRAMLQQHIQQRAQMTMALMPVADAARYGSVDVEKSTIVGFREKGQAGPGLINAGTYVLSKDFFAGMNLPERFSFEETVLMQTLDQIKPWPFIAAGYFIDIGVPEDYARAQKELPELHAH